MHPLPRPLSLAFFGISTFLALSGIIMVLTGFRGGWPVLALFGAGAFVFAHMLWPQTFHRRRVDAATLISRFPGPVTLYSSRVRYFSLAVGCAAFAVLLLFLLLDADPTDPPMPALRQVILWLGVGFLSLCASVMMAGVLVGQRLELDGDGFTMVTLGRRKVWRWQDVEGFKAGAMTPISVRFLPKLEMKMVVFDDLSLPETALIRISRDATGRNSGLHDAFGLDFAQLAWLLETWRETALAGTQAAPAAPVRDDEFVAVSAAYPNG